MYWNTLCDLLDLVGLMNFKLAIHTHGSTRLPSNEVFLASSTVSSEFKKNKVYTFLRFDCDSHVQGLLKSLYVTRRLSDIISNS